MVDKEIGELFASDEILREVDPEWTVEEMLSQRGMFRFSRVIEKLGLDPHKFRHFLRTHEDEDELYREWGITKGGQFRVRMAVFRHKVPTAMKRFKKGSRRPPPYYDPSMPSAFQTLPEDLTREEFFLLEGNYKLNDVMSAGMLPYELREVQRFIDNDGDRLPYEVCGVWKSKKFFLCRFEKFIVWIYSLFHRLEIAEAERIVGEMKRKAGKA